MNANYLAIKEILNQADAVVLGAGSGLSTAAGFSYSGETFDRYFSYMRDKYGVNDMYSAGFAPFEDEEEFWGYWAQFIYLERYATGAMPLYLDLWKLVKDKNYFVLTTNVDHQFQKAGFSKSRLFYTQGDYGLFQSVDPHNKKTYDNKDWVLKAIKAIDPKTHKIPSSIIPICPDGGEKMTTNLRCDDNFVEDEGWHKAARRYEAFLSAHSKGKVLYLELGVGYNTPGIIKYPFMRFTYQNKKATYITVSKDRSLIPDEIVSQTIAVQADLSTFIETLLTLS